MLGTLDAAAVEALLHDEVVGRLGCHADGRTYVVPIVYAYDGEAVYGHSRDGLKLRMMRANPRVCFEVDRMRDLANWESVIASGTFEELHGDRAAAAMARLVERLAPRMTGQGSARPPEGHGGGATAVAYRVVLDERTGRFERTP